MLFLTTLLSSLLALSGTLALPGALQDRQATDIDTTILNYALTLEYLEDAFYSGALAKFDEQAFADAGFPPWVRLRFTEIAMHEEQHVAFLKSALGSAATEPCTYSFPYTDPKSFAALSAALEGVGTAAYLGAAGLITDKDYVTAAGSVLVTEARHQAWVASAVEKGAPWGTAFQTPLDFNQVYTLAASFITSCPSSNPNLGVAAFPALTVSPSTLASGQKAKFTFDKSGSSGPYYAAFFSGLSTLFAEVGSDGSVTVPAGLEQEVFVVVSTNGTAVSDDSTVAGPAILSVPQKSFDDGGL